MLKCACRLTSNSGFGNANGKHGEISKQQSIPVQKQRLERNFNKLCFHYRQTAAEQLMEEIYDQLDLGYPRNPSHLFLSVRLILEKIPTT